MNAQGLQERSGKQQVWGRTAEQCRVQGSARKQARGAISGASAGGLRHMVERNPASVNSGGRGRDGCLLTEKPFGGPGPGRVKASVVSVKQPVYED